MNTKIRNYTAVVASAPFLSAFNEMTATGFNFISARLTYQTLVCLVLVLAVFGSSPTYAVSGNENWSSEIGLPGLDGPVFDMVSDGDGNVYVSGRFGQAGGIAVNNIAHWDGQGWNALGEGFDSSADSLALDGDGNLYAVGGNIQGVFRWNGEKWSAMSTGLTEVLFPIDIAVNESGDIYLGGLISLTGEGFKAQIARWDGSFWVSALDEVRIDANVFANEVRVSNMEIDENGLLYFSGPLIDPTGPGGPTGGIAIWDGNQLEVIDSAPDFNSVGEITRAPDGSLYAYATVKSADGALDNAIWHWDGGVWSRIVDIHDSGQVSALAISESGELIVGLPYGDGSVVQRWDGVAWVDMGTGIETQFGGVYALAFARSDTLVVGGIFDAAGGKPSNYIASFTMPQSNAFCNGLPVTVYLGYGDTPTSGDDVILGTTGDDNIVGMGGNDTICGLDGNDIISSGRGNDWVDAGPGNDTVEGGSGSDEIHGDSGVDILNGGPDADAVYGEADGDFIKGNSGNDYLDGGFGIDQILGGSGNDEIHTGSGGNLGTGLLVNGGAGNDIITGGRGMDSLRGETGNDIIYGGDARDELYGGGGNDVIYGQNGNDLIKGNGSKDTLYGGDGNDDLDGGDSDDVMYGSNGNDVMFGSTGNDRIFGGAGNDVVSGGGGSDILYGNRGDDQLYGGGSNDTLNGGSDTDTCNGEGGSDSATSCESQINVP